MNHSTERTQDFEQRPRTRPHAALPHDERRGGGLSARPRGDYLCVALSGGWSASDARRSTSPLSTRRRRGVAREAECRLSSALRTVSNRESTISRDPRACRTREPRDIYNALPPVSPPAPRHRCERLSKPAFSESEGRVVKAGPDTLQLADAFALMPGPARSEAWLARGSEAPKAQAARRTVAPAGVKVGAPLAGAPLPDSPGPRSPTGDSY